MAVIKKIILLASIIIIIVGCTNTNHNPDNKMSSYIAITNDGDSIDVNAYAWKWHEGSVYFYSEEGTLYIRNVKHILIKNK